MRWLLTLLVFLPTLAWGADCPGVTTPLSPSKTSVQNLTVSSTAVTLTVPAAARQATVYVENQPVRWTTDTTTPTSTVGVPAKADSVLVVCGASMSACKVIRSGSTDASLAVSYDQ